MLDKPKRIPRRGNNREKFCSSLDFSSCSWILNGNLQRNYDAYLKNNHFIVQDNLELENFEFFLRLLQQKTINDQTELANQHIQAYLQYPCLKACKNLHDRFIFFDEPRETWDIYVQLADKIIEDMTLIENMVKQYRKSSRYSVSLEAYLTFSIRTELISCFYRKTGYGKYTPWYELKFISKKKLINKLKNLGINEPNQIDKYIRARKYFYDIYSQDHIPGSRWVRPPSPFDKLDKLKNNNYKNNQIYEKVFEKAFEYAQKHEIHQENKIKTLKELIKLIDNCIEALKPPRQIPSPTLTPKPDSSNQDMLEPVRSVIKEVFFQLDEPHQLALALTLVFNLGREQTAQIIHEECYILRDGSTLGHWLISYRRKLLTEIAKYLQKKFTNQLQCQLTPEMLAPVEQALKEDLKPKTGVYIKQYGKEFIKRKIMTDYYSTPQNFSALSPIQYCQKWLNNFLPIPPTPRQNEAMKKFIEDFEEIDCDSG